MPAANARGIAGCCCVGATAEGSTLKLFKKRTVYDKRQTLMTDDQEDQELAQEGNCGSTMHASICLPPTSSRVLLKGRR